MKNRTEPYFKLVLVISTCRTMWSMTQQLRHACNGNSTPLSPPPSVSAFHAVFWLVSFLGGK